jgi:hypothetical protein
MDKKFRLGRIAGLEVYARRNVFVGFFVLWGAFSGLAYFALELTPMAALGMGLAGVYLHYTFEFWHQYSHAWAARRTGYPMEGVLYFMGLAISLYPRDEPELPAEVHIRRALGGPVGSIALGLFGGIVTWALHPFGGVLYWLAWFTFLENLLFFGLGALLPVGFTDGVTLLKWWPQRGAKP